MDEDECARLLRTDKEQLIPGLQKELESALARADYVMTNDLTVLQAFVLSLMASRSQDQNRRAWTLLGLAVRIAQALSLHIPEPPFPMRPFEREMRRRLWHAIGFLDIETAMDRASEPIMQASWFESHPLANVNDTDIEFDMNHPVPDSDAFTDMTFTLIILKAQSVARSLSFSDFTEPAVKSMTLRQQLVLDFKHTASRLLHTASPDRIPFHWMAHQVAQCTAAALQLISLRPLQRTTSFVPPRVRADSLLSLATTVLQRSHNLVADPRSRPWRWIEHLFVPWHGLAVAIAELCVCDDPALMHRYWPPVEAAFARLGGLVADTRRGLLWKPIEKIMARAQARRAQLLSGGFPAPLPTGLDGGASSSAETATVSLAPSDGISPWLSVWDAMESGDAGLGDAGEASWTNYEDFIGDLYESIDYSLMSTWSGAVG
ncbi:transcription factor domain-containing protein [Aspergillus clavatus NRRL 1]|uniref:Fungal specific transcription factor domain protein n=1 Tax=Aspergillus clavatus (strain ATCC 1007 / CBS 513.65 / DSM 816 / NCTC 3887 / NRRL 1 / QM 1276 / 107) TaxID=344612 RepID=A1CT71_ASPCL|nr:fungal specific transcription factor domain protein [Aspergillus clavatus NRRL 1]EAW06508.1 fungal specific transcription factor domain protein [Aspergillus clavatus NRRL 1]